jgi:DNA-binding transcriptional regulator YhcF (GntR family)
MSIDHIKWAIAQSIHPAAHKLILIVLANRANDEDQCWPSLASIVEDSNCNRATILRALSNLEQHGYIQRQKRNWKSTIYTLIGVGRKMRQVGRNLQQVRSQFATRNHKENPKGNPNIHIQEKKEKIAKERKENRDNVKIDILDEDPGF